jgi:TrmH family RNA methyltransferase
VSCDLITDAHASGNGTEITSLRNPLVAAARKLARPAERARRGQFLLEGARGIAAALDAHASLAAVLATPDGARRHPDLLEGARQAGADVRTVTDAVMAAVTQTATAPGLLAVAATVVVDQPVLPEHPRLVCVLDGVADPGNAGTVLRTADAVGADALATTAGSVHPEGPKAARAAAGSLFHLPVLAGIPWPSLRDACRARGLTLVGADPHAPATTDEVELERPCALVLGNEAHGLSAAARGGVDVLVRLPLPGRAESLNLAAAAAVLLYETARRQAAHRQATGVPTDAAGWSPASRPDGR